MFGTGSVTKSTYSLKELASSGSSWRTRQLIQQPSQTSRSAIATGMFRRREVGAPGGVTTIAIPVGQGAGALDVPDLTTVSPLGWLNLKGAVKKSRRLTLAGCNQKNLVAEAIEQIVRGDFTDCSNAVCIQTLTVAGRGDDAFGIASVCSDGRGRRQIGTRCCACPEDGTLGQVVTVAIRGGDVDRAPDDAALPLFDTNSSTQAIETLLAKVMGPLDKFGSYTEMLTCAVHAATESWHNSYALKAMLWHESDSVSAKSLTCSQSGDDVRRVLGRDDVAQMFLPDSRHGDFTFTWACLGEGPILFMAGNDDTTVVIHNTKDLLIKSPGDVEQSSIFSVHQHVSMQLAASGAEGYDEGAVTVADGILTYACNGIKVPAAVIRAYSLGATISTSVRYNANADTMYGIATGAHQAESFNPKDLVAMYSTLSEANQLQQE